MSGSMEYSLRVVAGSSFGEEFVLMEGDERVLGSESEADIRFKGEGVEARHARVRFEGHELRVVDISKRRSMRVNGSRQKSARLESGDQLALGAVTLQVTRRVSPQNGSTQGAVNGAAHNGSPAEPTIPRPPSATVAGESARTQAGGTGLIERPRARPVEHSHQRARRLERDDGNVGMGPLEERGLWWPKDELPPLQLQHVWFDLARDDGWRSLAVVPTDDSTPALPVAHAFARMASLNPNSHVLVVDASPREPHGVHGSPFAGTIASQVTQFPQANYDFLDASSLGMNDAEVAHLYVPQLLEYIASGTGRYNKVLIATGSLISHARSIPVARAVDAVLLNVGQGTSRLPNVNRTVEIVGRSRVVGSLVIEPVD